MGLLDDAIRQHLELKRQHGADESEVRRKEDEALGPARREAPVAEQAAADQPDVHPGGEELEGAMAPEETWLPEETLPPTDDPATGPAAEELAESEEPAADTPEGGRPPSMESEAFEEDSPLAEGAPVEEGEDVLEETPEFLQETPEHDRLWFEQKPPRDFDLDDG
ncbi:MAG: hypothetical protein WKF40_08755 [Thermoleophilaceae bacterium]